jgi:hypothetical protein
LKKENEKENGTQLGRSSFSIVLIDMLIHLPPPGRAIPQSATFGNAKPDAIPPAGVRIYDSP